MSAIKSRRDFVIAGAVALAGVTLPVGSPAQAGQEMSQGIPLNRKNLSHLSNAIFASQASRKAFLQDPQRFAAKAMGGKVRPSDMGKLKELQQMVSVGFCCHGCGCGQNSRRQVDTR